MFEKRHYLAQIDLSRRARQLQAAITARVGEDESALRQLRHHAQGQRLRDEHFLLDLGSGQQGLVPLFGEGQYDADCVVGLAVDSDHGCLNVYSFDKPLLIL